MGRRVGEVAQPQVGGEFGSVSIAVEGGGEAFRRLVPFAQQHAQDERARVVAAHDMRGGETAAQRVIDEVADRRTVAAAGETVRTAPIGQALRDRPAGALPLLQHLDRALRTSAQPHEPPAIRVSQTSHMSDRAT